MNIVVLVKTGAEHHRSPNRPQDRQTSSERAWKASFNPEDRHALEAALNIRETAGGQGDGLDHGAATSDGGRV